ncbi:ribonuclease Z [Flavobacterium sp. MAHUQ-51]|uniref:ribonuclease Z n=1 Tax=Flavobacterium sp. GCM10022190 TaxID=3252639 RepID=UPI00362044EB
MKVDQKEHTITIKDTQGDFDSFLTKVSSQYKSFENHNIIIDLLSYKEEITVSNLKLFLPLSKQHKKSKKSFVIVVADSDYNALPEKLTVVPSLLEAHDIIEMEEIERDLGF